MRVTMMCLVTVKQLKSQKAKGEHPGRCRWVLGSARLTCFLQGGHSAGKPHADCLPQSQATCTPADFRLSTMTNPVL